MERSTLFIVRIWRQRSARGAGAFRASVRAVDADRVRLFTRPAELARYLARSVAHGPPADRDRLREPR